MNRSGHILDRIWVRPLAAGLQEYDLSGSGKALVFLHGLGGTSRYWSCRLSEAQPKGHTFLVDLLGFGGSPRPWGNYTIERHLHALHTTLQRHGKIVLIGHSLGAAISLAYASRYPQKIEALVLISLPVFHSEQSAYRWLRRNPSGWLLTNMIVVGLACIITRRVVGKILPFFLPNYPLEVVEDVARHNVFSATTSLWNVLYDHDISKEVEKLSADIPVLCIHSENDDSAPYVNVNDLSQRNANWTLRTMRSVGHHPWLWETRSCVKLIDEFLVLIDSAERGKEDPRATGSSSAVPSV